MFAFRGGRDTPKGRSLEEVIELARVFEAAYFDEEPYPSRWIATHNALKPKRRSMKHLVQLKLDRALRPGSSVEVRTSLHASRVRLKNNVLLFYKETGTVAKLFYRRSALEAHLEGLRFSKRMNRVKAPEVLSFGTDPVPYVVHPIVGDQSPTERELANTDGLLSDLVRLHSQSMDRVQMGLSVCSSGLIRNYAQDHRLIIGSRTAAAFTEGINCEGLRGDTHGDLSRKNFIVGKELFLIDWESFSHDFVVRDLLYTRPNRWGEYVRGLSNVGIQETEGSLRNQAAVHLIKQISSSIENGANKSHIRAQLDRVESLLQHAT